MQVNPIVRTGHFRAVSRTKETRLTLPRTLWRIYVIVTLFLGILTEIAWTSFWLRNRHPDQVQPRWDTLFRRQAVRFRKAAEQLGGLVIKVGQFLSSRVDLLPKPYIDELQKLQDNVVAAPWDQIRPIIEREIGIISETFQFFEETPLAAASFGQVYKAQLLTGEEVAVKVQRPNITAIVLADLKALSLVVQLTARLTSFGRTFDLYTVLREFRRTVFQEIDYRKELSHTEIIRAELKDIPYLHIPKTYPELSSHRVLVMDFWDGIKINQKEQLKEAGISPTVVAERAIHLYLRMVMETGVFHADPHPGNILVKGDGSLVLLDYGMVGTLDPASKRQIRRLFVAVSDRNAQELVESLGAMGMIRPQANRHHLKRQVSYLFDRYYAETLNQLTDLDLPALLRDFEALLRDEAIQVPGHFAFLGRAIAILVGLATGLDPDINLVRLFAPYAKRFVTEDAGGVAGYTLDRVRKWSQTIVDLPLLTTQIFNQIDAGDIEAKIHWDQGGQELRRLTRSVLGLSQALYTVGFVIAGALLMNSRPLYGNILFGLAAASLVLSWARNLRR